MKKYGLCFLGLIFALWAFPQEKANSALPLHPRPGRVLKVMEVLRIPIEGEGYFYEGARAIEIDKDGNLYIKDSWSSARKPHLLKFSPEGRFADSFFIDIKGRVLRIAEGFLYASLNESDSDPNAIPALVKYRIGEPIGAK